MKTDVYKTIVLDSSNTTPVRAWALVELGEINKEWIFPNKTDAISKATVFCGGEEDVIEVIVTGDQVERA